MSTEHEDDYCVDLPARHCKRESSPQTHVINEGLAGADQELCTIGKRLSYKFRVSKLSANLGSGQHAWLFTRTPLCSPEPYRKQRPIAANERLGATRLRAQPDI